MKMEILPKIEKGGNKDEIKKVLEKEKTSLKSVIETLKKDYPTSEEEYSNNKSQ